MRASLIGDMFVRSACDKLKADGISFVLFPCPEERKSGRGTPNSSGMSLTGGAFDLAFDFGPRPPSENLSIARERCKYRERCCNLEPAERLRWPTTGSGRLFALSKLQVPGGRFRAPGFRKIDPG